MVARCSGAYRASMPPATIADRRTAARAKPRRDVPACAQAVSLSPAAADFLREQALIAGAEPGLRISVHAGGCAGLEYQMALLGADEIAGPDDDEIHSEGIRVLVDRRSAAQLAGSVIDAERSLTRAGLVVRNPNATQTCGCGESFCA